MYACVYKHSVDSVIAERMSCVFVAVEVVVEEPVDQQQWDD